MATVLRTEDDLAYGFDDRDRWDPAKPYDNVHCSYFINYVPDYEAYFSSAGCLTVRGRKAPASHQWQKYQAVLDVLGQGKRIDLVLLTGREYAIACANKTDADVHPALTRLRVGSQGDEVSRLQVRLGFTNPTGYFGPKMKLRLTENQKTRGLPADGVYSPRLDAPLGWEVFDA